MLLFCMFFFLLLYTQQNARVAQGVANPSLPVAYSMTSFPPFVLLILTPRTIALW